MSLVTNTNVSSLIAQHRLSSNSQIYQRSLERLSSGFRINRAADDVAGLNIAENLVGQTVRMKQAQRNTQDGISSLQIAEGALNTITDSLQRLRELTVQAANDSNGTASRNAIETEVKALLTEIDRIAASSNFNNIQLLNGSVVAGTATVQIGPNSTAATNTIDISPALTTATNSALGTLGGVFASIAAVDFPDASTARSFLNDIDSAITQAVNQRASIGAFQNQLESVISNLDLMVENFSTSTSRIRDLDVASETATMVQYQVLQQASATVLSQTNNLPQLILSLLKN